MNEDLLASRITDLEVKFSFIEEHVTQQDREILKLRTQMEKQSEELLRIKAESNSDSPMIRGDERPPHY